MSGRIMRAIGLIVTAGLVLSACTGSPGESEASPSSADDPTPVVSASPSPTVPPKPERPEAMNREDAEGAAAAAKYFIELYPYVMATGDVEEFKAMSHRACGFCEDALKQAEKLRSRNETWTGGEIKTDLRETYERDEITGIYPLDFEVEQAAARITDSTGATVFEGKNERATYRVELGLRDGDWVVAEIAARPAQ
ncbi:DUF6318 family protein [Promicromonospora kroppenstedtii]|uniref:DUF6318 family protein n=1 Tax=Promicromonospora kroppenstedtii TaxID=440482 RepID=A0ABW7XJD7_9MICO